MFVLCLDTDIEGSLEKLKLPHVVPIPLKELENNDQELLTVKKERSTIEYYFTSTPAFIYYLFNKYLEVNLLTYLDADLYFYSSLQPIFDEMGNNSILIIPHRFSRRNMDLEKVGKYNVAFNSFRRDKEGMECVHLWRKQCLEWCYDRCEDGKFAEQKYLDAWPAQFNYVCVLNHKGANLAPWNLERYRITFKDTYIYVDNQPLIFYHFEGFWQLSSRLFDPRICYKDYRVKREVLKRIHFSYVLEISREGQKLKNILEDQKTIKGSYRRKIHAHSELSLLKLITFFLEGNCVLVFAGRCLYAYTPTINFIISALRTIRKNIIYLTSKNKSG